MRDYEPGQRYKDITRDEDFIVVEIIDPDKPKYYIAVCLMQGANYKVPVLDIEDIFDGDDEKFKLIEEE